MRAVRTGQPGVGRLLADFGHDLPALPAPEPQLRTAKESCDCLVARLLPNGLTTGCVAASEPSQ